MAIARPLHGITVLDFGQVYNGPYCGFLLAQAGARVIKVESRIGEPLRTRAESTSANYAFELLNGGKECITLNIKSSQGQQLLKQLVGCVDVLLENFAPGTLADYGLGSDTLCGLNPRLIYAASTGYGGSGRYSDYLGMDITIQAMTGVMSVTGEGDGPPLKAGVAMCDFLGGIHLYGGITSALYQREQTGQGAVLDISMQDCVFPTLSTALGGYFRAGEQGPRTGNRHAAGSAAPYNVYAAKDGHVAMICIREGHWRNLCAAMQRPELADDLRFVDMRSRAANVDELDAEIERWSTRLTKHEIFTVAQQHSVICAPVQDLADVVNDPHMHERGSLHWYQQGSVDDTLDDDVLVDDAPAQEEGRSHDAQLLMSTPIRFRGMDAPPPESVAVLGAHTDRILQDLLGLGADDIAALRDAQAI